MHFTIKYVRRWFSPGDKNDDIKDETIICSDGSVIARQYDHHSSNGHFRLIKRATGTVSPIEAIKLYIHLKRMVQHCHYERLICDEYDEVIITEPGLKIILAGSLYDENKSVSELIEDLLKTIVLNFE